VAAGVNSSSQLTSSCQRSWYGSLFAAAITVQILFHAALLQVKLGKRPIGASPIVFWPFAT
jgi:hypothetical protein